MNTAKPSQSDPTPCCPTCGTAPNTASSATACTLPPESLGSRLSEISDLARRALLQSERSDLALRLCYRPSAEGKVNELIERESECCGFLVFDVEKEPDRFLVTVTAPKHAEAAVRQLFDAFEGRTPRAAQ